MTPLLHQRIIREASHHQQLDLLLRIVPCRSLRQFLSHRPCVDLIARSSNVDGSDITGALRTSSLQQLKQVDSQWEHWTWDGLSQENPSTVESAIAALIEAATLAVPLRKQERGLQVANVRCIHRLVRMACAEVHRPILQELGVDSLALLTESLCVLGGRLRFSEEVDYILEILEPEALSMDLDRVAGLVYRLAESDHWSPLLNPMSRRAGELSWRMSPNQFAVLLRGFARLNFVPHHLLSAKSVHHIEKRVVKKLTVPRLVNSLWCLTVLNQTQHRLFTLLWEALCGLEETGMDLRRTQLSQMLQVGLSLQHETRDGCPPLSHSKILKAAQGLSQQLLTGAPTVSSYQRSVGVCLTSMGKHFVEEHSSTGLLLDFFLPDDNLAIEVDGPTHFTRNTLQPLGSTALKRRLVAAVGMRLVSITLEEWDGLLNLKEQRAFLGRAIQRQMQA